MEAEPREPVPELGLERAVDLEPLRVGCLPEEGCMDPQEPRELLDRRLVVVDPEIDERVGEPRVAALVSDDEQRRRLLAPPVASCRLSGCEAGDEPLGERLPRSP